MLSKIKKILIEDVAAPCYHHHHHHTTSLQHPTLHWKIANTIRWFLNSTFLHVQSFSSKNRAMHSVHAKGTFSEKYMIWMKLHCRKVIWRHANFEWQQKKRVSTTLNSRQSVCTFNNEKKIRDSHLHHCIANTNSIQTIWMAFFPWTFFLTRDFSRPAFYAIFTFILWTWNCRFFVIFFLFSSAYYMLTCFFVQHIACFV